MGMKKIGMLYIAYLFTLLSMDIPLASAYNPIPEIQKEGSVEEEEALQRIDRIILIEHHLAAFHAFYQTKIGVFDEQLRLMEDDDEIEDDNEYFDDYMKRHDKFDNSSDKKFCAHRKFKKILGEYETRKNSFLDFEFKYHFWVENPEHILSSKKSDYTMSVGMDEKIDETLPEYHLNYFPDLGGVIDDKKYRHIWGSTKNVESTVFVCCLVYVGERLRKKTCYPCHNVGTRWGITYLFKLLE